MNRVLLANQFPAVGVSLSSGHGGNHAAADSPALDFCKRNGFCLQFCAVYSHNLSWQRLTS